MADLTTNERQARLAAAQAAVDAAGLPVPVTLAWGGNQAVVAVLGDTAPGYRQQDALRGSPLRGNLRRQLCAVLTPLALHLVRTQASYSCLRPVPGLPGFVGRVDADGKIIGTYRQE